MNIHNSIEHQPLQVKCIEISKSEIPSIQQKWLILAEKTETQFFLSWRWIANWLNQVIDDNKIVLVSAHSYTSEIIALGLFVEKKSNKLGLIPCTQWFLHRTGKRNYDQIWIENNNFLIAKGYEESALTNIWRYLSQSQPHVDEFIISVSKGKTTNQKHLPNSYSLYKSDLHSGYKVNLHNYKDLNDYLSQLSKNTRQQVNRSISLLNKSAAIELKIWNTDQFSILNKHKHLHIKKWKNTNTPSGFSNPLFEEFHQQLNSAQDFAYSQNIYTLVAEINSGEAILGCAYYLVDHGHIYFYLACLSKIENNKLKLGLAIHAKVIEWLILNKPEINVYDFLAGDARYKKSLAQTTEAYCNLIIYKKNYKYLLSVTFKSIKDRLWKIFNNYRA
ncbi:GNAT family N-acetyltransferase [Thalassotalea nanhaiensis]|uniref:GNAT family N-acetyltransferase n=1 Tax=Thalassotalea nanhaiensis TaxID=3065648 RepID=A0ABY9THZ0_9GAMM|nr:GNAT family N-acetyltransferase [Colwelliaceae bacterium SQ345]